MQKESIIYSFLDPIDFLKFEFRTRQRRDPKFTLRKWAVQLGYENPSYLAHILKKERKLKIEVAEKMARVFHLSAKERSYFELIVLRNNAETPTEKNLYSKLLRKVRPKRYWELDDFPLEKFEFASEWYNWAILELFYLKDFVPSVEYVQAKLGPAVTKKMAKESIEKLAEIGFLVKTPTGFERGSDSPMFLKPIPSWAVRSYHKAMLDKAKDSVDRVAAENRQARGTMVALSRKGFEEGRKVIEEAHKRLLELSAESDGEYVYHFTTNLFPVTNKMEENLQ